MSLYLIWLWTLPSTYDLFYKKSVGVDFEARGINFFKEKKKEFL
jgi:hypothetical protein